MRPALLAALLLTAAGPALAAQNWGTNQQQFDADYPASRPICRAATAPVPPPPPGPPPAADCVSEDLYYGIGRPADPAAARRCAMAERAKDPEGDATFAGDAMLMTMFANGVGAPRDLEVALALACRLNGAPAEMDGRVNHLAALKTGGAGGTAFGYCDDITSGFAQGQCALHDSRFAAATRRAGFAAIAGPLAGPGKAAFDRLHAAMEAFARARGDQEVDQQGTGRAAFQIEAVDAVRDELLAILQSIGTRTPAAEPLLPEADKALNVAYRDVMAVKNPQWGTPTRQGIQDTERTWIAYRDALGTFTGSQWGPAAGDAAMATLTRQRTHELREFLP